MRLEHHLVGGYVRYISPHIIIIVLLSSSMKWTPGVVHREGLLCFSMIGNLFKLFDFIV